MASLAVALCYLLGALLACFACAAPAAAHALQASAHAECCGDAPTSDSDAACQAICQSLPAQAGPRLEKPQAAQLAASPALPARGLKHGPEPPPPRLAERKQSETLFYLVKEMSP